MTKPRTGRPRILAGANLNARLEENSPTLTVMAVSLGSCRRSQAKLDYVRSLK